MSVVEGGTFDPADAAVGPARLIVAPSTAPVPTDPYVAMKPVADAQGFYPTLTPWRDTGLSVDAPTWSRSRETTGLEFQQVKGTLFDRVTSDTRTLTASIAGINASNLALIEGINESDITEIATSAGKPAATKVPFGTGGGLKTIRGIVMFERGDDVAPVIEPGGATRPPALYYVVPTLQLSAEEDNEFEVASGEAVATSVSFKQLPTPGLPRGLQHGFWYLEKPGSFVAAA